MLVKMEGTWDSSAVGRIVVPDPGDQG
jgi:hypothetical protein